MARTLAEWMVLFITVNLIFTPLLTSIDSMHRDAIEVTLTEGAKEAAIEGRLTPEIIKEMKKTLVEGYNFDESKIIITGTSKLTPRNEYIEATIEVPRTFIFILNIFNQGPRTISKSTKILSEY